MEERRLPEETVRLTVGEEVQEGRTETLCDRRIVVIGGGFAGIAAAKALSCRGATVTVLESQATIGGVWAMNEYPEVSLQVNRTCAGVVKSSLL